MLQYFANLKVAYKLTLGFGLILVLMCSTLAADSVASTRQSAITQHLVEHLYPQRKLAHEIKLLTYQSETDAASYLLSHDPKQAASYLDTYTADVAQLRTTVLAAQALSENATQHMGLNQFFTFYFGTGGYNEERVRTFREKQAGQLQVADDDFLDDVSLSSVLTFADRYMQVIEGEIAREVATERAFAQLVLILNFSLGGLAILLGVGITLLVVRSITRPLQQVQRAIHQVSTVEIADLNRGLTALAQGDLTMTMQADSPPPLYNSRDEIGQTAQAVRSILVDVHHTVQGYETARLELGQLYGQLAEQNQALSSANARLEQLSTTDPLTGLPNHRALMDILSHEMERTQRYHRLSSLLFLDLDHFKALNDNYGHGAGDVALCELGRLLQQSIRGIDSVGRWGGEEFVVLLPETDTQEALALAERIREAVSTHTFAIGGGLHLTCSIGISSTPTHAQQLPELIEAADQAMYAAKQLGRNQVRSIDDPAVAILREGHASAGGREETALRGTIEALVALVEHRDALLGDHSSEVANLVYHLALALGVAPEEAQMMMLAGRLHDIGKVAVPDAILQKSARLSEEEWVQMKRHPAVGAEVLAHIPSLRPLTPVIRAHHERWDGMGYPDQLQGEQIPLAARMITVVDAYMAMVVDRPYQQGRSAQEALMELRRCAGTQFDPAIVEALCALLQASMSRQEADAQVG